MTLCESHPIIALINLLMSSAIVIICGCRIDLMSKSTKKTIQGTYALLLTAAASSGLQPLFFHECPGYADLTLNAALLCLLLAGRALWPKKVPACYTSECTDRQPKKGDA